MRKGKLIGLTAACLVIISSVSRAGSALTDEQRADVAAMIANAHKVWCADLEASVPEARGKGPCFAEGAKAATVTRGESPPALQDASGTTTKPPASGSSSQERFSTGEKVADAPALFLGTAGQTVLDNPVDNGKSRFELTTTNQSSRAGFRLSKTSMGTDESNKKTFSTWSATLSTPVSKAGPDTNIATLDGFANSTSLAVNFTQYSLTGAIHPTPKQLLDFVNKAGLPKKILGDDSSAPDVDLDEIQQALVQAHRLELYKEAESMFFAGDSLRWTWGVNGTVGYQSDDFFKPGTLAPANSKSSPWSAGLYGGFFPRSTNIYLSAAFDLAHAYKLGKTRTFCPSGEAPVECVTGSFGAPKETEQHLISLSGRTEIAGAGVGFKITHDVKSGDSGVDLPIYLFKDDKRNLNGGLRFGWTNTDQFSAGLFVGSTFDISGN